MKKNFRKNSPKRALLWVSSMALACMIALCGFNSGVVASHQAYAEAASQVLAAEPVADPSPAIYVSQKNANSVVGVITNTQQWDRSSGEVKETLYSQGSGVVIAKGASTVYLYTEIRDGDTVSVPSLIGLSLAQANKLAINCGLNLSVRGGVREGAEEIYKVTAQDISPAAEVKRGSVILIYVAAEGHND